MWLTEENCIKTDPDPDLIIDAVNKIKMTNINSSAIRQQCIETIEINRKRFKLELSDIFLERGINYINVDRIYESKISSKWITNYTNPGFDYLFSNN